MPALHSSSNDVLLSGGVEEGPSLFQVIAPAGWADDAARFVMVKTQLLSERLQAIRATEKP